MNLKKVLQGASVLFLAGCQSGQLQTTSLLPSNEVIIEKKASAKAHPEEGFIFGQVQVAANETEIQSIVENLQSQGIEASILDRVEGRPLFLLETKSTKSMDEIVDALKSDSRVLMASKNYRVKIDALITNPSPAPATQPSLEAPAASPLTLNAPAARFRTNDTLFGTQWALSNRGQEAPRALPGKIGADISMSGVPTLGSKDIVVAVIDTGIDYLHKDLSVFEMKDGVPVINPERSNIWINPGEIPGNKVNDDANGIDSANFIDDVHGYDFVNRDGDPMDDHGHGTHCAGVVGALRNNSEGIAGMNERVSLMALKFLDSEGGGSLFEAQQALYYIIDMAKRFPEKKFITSNSWGSGSRGSRTGKEDDFLLLAFAEATRAGVLHVAAAGNAGVSNRFSGSFPANYSTEITQVITVAATDNNDQLASFSSYGFENVQVAAPGVLIQSTVPAKLFPKPYEAWSGTSMATPHVSGLAALVWAANPEMTAMEVQERILGTVDILPQLKGVVSSGGRINVQRALAGDLNPRQLRVEREVAFTQESPRGDDRNVYELLVPITHPGAKEISVCFERINLDDDMDWIEILGSDYRVKDTMTGTYLNRNYLGERVDLCSPPVAGDTLYVRLSNQGSNGGTQGYKTSNLKVVE